MEFNPEGINAFDYAVNAIDDRRVPKYVKLQCKDFIRICRGADKKYFLNPRKLNQLNKILSLLIMPKGLKAGKPLSECTTGYQWLFYTAIFCVMHRSNPNKRRYETGILEICRKNFKTFTVATIFIILFLTEPKFSKFFSVAPDGSLSKEIREAISEILKSSPQVYEHGENKRFKVLRDYIMFKPTQTVYTPLSFSTSRMDGRMPNAFVADEVGALPISYPIDAMRSGQLNVLNKLGFIISTKYPTHDNPFEDEVGYAKKILDGIEKDETVFSLLYEPNETKGWESNDLILQQANPASLEIPEIWEDLLKKRARAIAVESDRENFITKHCNIIYQGAETETFVDVADVQKCRRAKIDWTGRVVYVGLDLSESNDNTSVSIVSVDENNELLADSFAFIPEDRIEEKTVAEKVNYRELIKTGKVIPCGDRVISYATVEEFILTMEKRMGVTIQAVGYDRWNALSTAQKLEKNGLNTVEIRQHSAVLHSPTKLLKEKILCEGFQYERNPLLEINFQNARCIYDTNKNLYVAKKRSKGKVDMVVSLINAVYLAEQDCFLNQIDWMVQVI